MKASEVILLEFLSIRKQLVIPIYQRTYSWSRKQCQQLWDDVYRVATDDTAPAHFVGSIVYIQEGIYHASSTQQMLVIDGQQRLTTVSLLLLALAHTVEEKEGDLSKAEIYDYYLLNNHMKGDMRYKIMLTQSDKDTFIYLLEGRDLPPSPSQRIIDNYQFFLEVLRKTDLDLQTVYQGINKLVVVDVSLDRNYDNPQLIFESLNSTGLDLTQADLIRNYVLMGLSPSKQEDIYNRFWYPMEQRFGHAEYAALFDRFMRDYLTIKSDAGTIPNIGEVYNEFKKYIKGQDIESVVADVALYSRYFVKLAFPNRNEDTRIRQIIENINTLKVDVAYPFLLEVFDDFERNRLLSREDFIEILLLVESYVFRRAIVGIPTNSMNKTFATFKRSIRKDDYLNSVKYAFISLDSYRRFPSNNEFWNEFVIKDVYNLLQRRNYLLSKLENHNRKEFVNIAEYTIEHILPQNPSLSQEWRDELGPDWKDIHARYLHTIGNLTLTGYNPELSDRSFKDKRDMKGGFSDSPLRLNRGLGKLTRWGIKEIEDRAQELADLALEIWAYPSIEERILDKYDSKLEMDREKYSLENFEYLNGDILNLFQLLRTRVLNLDASVREEVKQKYIAYKTTTNFIDVQPQKSRLRIWLNIKFDEIHDPKKICRNVADIGHYGNGEVEFGLDSPDDIDYVMCLVQQSFEKHIDQMFL